jgi:hypothetical protein
VIAVKTVNPGENSRWFAGAGIYREVTLSLSESAVHRSLGGICHHSYGDRPNSGGPGGSFREQSGISYC